MCVLQIAKRFVELQRLIALFVLRGGLTCAECFQLRAEPEIDCIFQVRRSCGIVLAEFANAIHLYGEQYRDALATQFSGQCNSLCKAGLENSAFLTPGEEIKKAYLYGAFTRAVLVRFSNATALEVQWDTSFEWSSTRKQT